MTSQRGLRRLGVMLACTGAFVMAGSASAQHVPAQSERDQTSPHGGRTQAQASAVEPMDPVLQAILLAMAARVLREAAASPDPLDALGRTLERSVASAAADPRTLKTIEALTSQALKDTPPELRHALIEFIAGALAHARREREAARSSAR